MAEDSTLPPCKNFGDDDGKGGVVCMNRSDPRYTMDFTDVEPGAFIHWCSACGPEAHAMNAALQSAFEDRGDEFTEQLEAAIEAAETRNNQ